MIKEIINDHNENNKDKNYDISNNNNIIIIIIVKIVKLTIDKPIQRENNQSNKKGSNKK